MDLNDVKSLVDGLDVVKITMRIRELAAEQAALAVLLRAARARQSHRPREESRLETVTPEN
jgi:hypothetical protein